MQHPKWEHRIYRNFFCFFLAILICLPAPSKAAQAATKLSGTSIIAYTLSGNRVTTYSLTNGKDPGAPDSKFTSAGYIDPTDKCTISDIYSNGWLKVSYPTAKGSKTAYAKSSDFFLDPNFPTNKSQIGSRLTVYRKPDMSNILGTVYGDDEVIIIGNQTAKTQIMYPVSGGYKLGWINGVYLSEGYYRIKSAVNTNYVLDVYGASKKNGENVQVYQGNGGDHQVFYFKRVTGNYYTITAKHSGKVLDVEKGRKIDGTNILQYSLNKNGSDNQLWAISMNPDGSYSFRSKCNDRYLDLKGAEAKNGGNIQCWSGNGTLAQKFFLERAKATPSLLTYQAYSGGFGWLGAVKEGETAGITGQAIPMKALAIELKNGNSSGIAFRAHCTDIGWMDWQTSGGLTGSTDLAGAIEAVQIQLQNGLENDYDVYYRAHCSDYGWLGWAKNGETAGTTGYAKQMEALEIRLVEKDAPFDAVGVAIHERTGESGNAEAKIAEIIAYEISQLGVGDHQGDNNVEYTNWYYGKKVSGSGYAWCMTFQAYVAWKCGVLDFAIPRRDSCSAAIQWYKDRGQFHLSQYYGGDYVPKAGDLVFYGKNGGEHVGMIIADPVNGYLQVIEGNVKTDNGDYQVVQFTHNAKRTLTNSYVYGYASPDYGTPGDIVSKGWDYPLESCYVCGNDWLTYYSKRPQRPYHIGIDIFSKAGDYTVYAPADGIVKKTGQYSANGNYIILGHTVAGKTIYSFYAHLKDGGIRVQEGNTVAKGDPLATVGNTGASSGDHLHFAVVDTYWANGGYYGYAAFSGGDSVYYEGVTYYNPHYVVKYGTTP